MSARPSEERAIHTRLLKCALEIEDCRAWWAHAEPDATPEVAFEQWWFGDRSLDRVRVLFSNFRARFDAFPPSMPVLRRWGEMSPPTRALVCHWHLQLSDPLYRAFTGDYLVGRRSMLRPDVTRDLVVEWVGQQGPGRWTMATRIQFASKLLSAAYSSGLVGSNRDPRPLLHPRVEDAALAYLVYLLREVDVDGTLLANPYLRSVGLEGAPLEERLRPLIGLRRQGDLVEIGWPYPSLEVWAAGELA